MTEPWGGPPGDKPPRPVEKRERQPEECPKCGKPGTFYPWGDTAVECPVHGLFIGGYEEMVESLPTLPDTPPEMPWIQRIPDSPDD